MNLFPDLQLFPFHFHRKSIFSFQLAGYVDGYRSGWKLSIRKDMLQNIGIKKAWTCTSSRNGNEPNSRNKNFFRIKWMQRCSFWYGYKTQIQIANCQISRFLNQPVNRVVSTTAFLEYFLTHTFLFWISFVVLSHLDLLLSIKK